LCDINVWNLILFPQKLVLAKISQNCFHIEYIKRYIFAKPIQYNKCIHNIYMKINWRVTNFCIYSQEPAISNNLFDDQYFGFW
jgi:hypothetical protein